MSVSLMIHWLNYFVCSDVDNSFGEAGLEKKSAAGTADLG